MLYDYLERFNVALELFQKIYPKENWSPEFKSKLINDYSFYSARVEDEKLKYGDTIKFLNDQLVPKGQIKSLLEISNHRDVLSALIDRYDDFCLTEDVIKSIHKDLMSCEKVWDVDYKEHLVGNYRNIPTVGYREPFFENKQYAPHYNLDIIMATSIDIINAQLEVIDNTKNQTHLITRLVFLHNVFLNKIHPFADGNGRVCRILMGTIMMKNNCPPIFKRIISDEDRFDYINAVVECEKVNSDNPLIKFLAIGLSEYLEDQLQNG